MNKQTNSKQTIQDAPSGILSLCNRSLSLQRAAPVADGGVPPTAPGVGNLEIVLPSGESVPRGVIRGESLENSPYSGESVETFATGYKGQVKQVYTPLAKADAEPLAALTDYLNTTFPFGGSEQTLIELKNYLGMFLDSVVTS